MAEAHSDRVHPETVVLDIIYTKAELRGRENRSEPAGERDADPCRGPGTKNNGRSVFAAVFPGLRAGDYDIWENFPKPSGTVTIVGGEVATVDWR